ncbi:MAG: hypothetical protein DLM70_03385, partial [Chloroflexi bacterium]
MHIRPFTTVDYPAVAAIHNAAFPKEPTTAGKMRDRDEHRHPKTRAERWVAEEDGQIIGVGEYSQSTDLYHPRKFQIIVYFHPDRQQHGLGGALYCHVARTLSRFDPIAFQARAREDEAVCLRFLEARGFLEDFRTWESHLDVLAFDPLPWRSVETRVRAESIRIVSLADLAGDPDRDGTIYDLEWETSRDIPSPPSITPNREELTVEERDVQFARYREGVLNGPDYPAGAFLVALRDGEYVGLSYGEADPERRVLDIDVTGVRLAYRGRGIAQALKVRGIAYARENGYRTIRTWNDTVNRPILV